MNQTTMSKLVLVSVLLGLLVTALVHLALEGSLLPVRGTIPAVAAGVRGIAVTVGALLAENWAHRR